MSRRLANCKLVKIFEKKREQFRSNNEWMNYLKNTDIGIEITRLDNQMELFNDWLWNENSKWFFVLAYDYNWMKISKETAERILALGGLP